MSSKFLWNIDRVNRDNFFLVNLYQLKYEDFTVLILFSTDSLWNISIQVSGM